jgi:hypothetical protein
MEYSTRNHLQFGKGGLPPLSCIELDKSVQNGSASDRTQLTEHASQVECGRWRSRSELWLEERRLRASHASRPADCL